jgi:hypothetical protein
MVARKWDRLWSVLLSAEHLTSAREADRQGARDLVIDFVHFLYFPNMGHMAMVRTYIIGRPSQVPHSIQVSSSYTLKRRRS